VQAGSIGTIKTRANVCSVQFQPDTARSIAIGSADHKIYCYDLRHIRAPYCTLVGHTKTVSYVKYLDASTIVSASTDNSLKLWDLSMSPGRIIDSPVQTFKGHTNTKVG
jgi:WD40 repeat protein